MQIHSAHFIGYLILCLLSTFGVWRDRNACAADVDAGECLRQYRGYLDSFGCISYTMTMGKGIIKSSYNGQYYHAISYDTDSPDKVLEISYDKCWTTLICDKDGMEDPVFLLTYRDPSNETRKLYEGMTSPGLLGVVHFGPPLGSFVILDLLRSMPLTVTKERENGADLVLLSGKKEDILLDVKAWFDPVHKFALRKIILTRTGSIKPGDIVSFSFFFDKYTNVKSIPLPTEYRWTLVQINPDNGKEHTDTGITVLSDFSISDNANPRQFPFVTKIPNGTKVIAEDVPQIEYIWLDGKIVPKTDEVMLAIARGGHKFMPGPDEPRFWLMSIGIFLIVLSCSVKAYRYFKSQKVQ